MIDDQCTLLNVLQVSYDAIVSTGISWKLLYSINIFLMLGSLGILLKAGVDLRLRLLIKWYIN